MVWRLADAETRLGELVTKALAEGPQKITVSDDSVVVLSQEHFDRLSRRKMTFAEFLLSAPKSEEGLDLARDDTPLRDIDW